MTPVCVEQFENHQKITVRRKVRDGWFSTREVEESFFRRRLGNLYGSWQPVSVENTWLPHIQQKELDHAYELFKFLEETVKTS